MLETLLKRKTISRRQRVGIVAGIVVAAAAARELSRFAGRALGYASVLLHLVDNVQIRIVHCR